MDSPRWPGPTSWFNSWAACALARGPRRHSPQLRYPPPSPSRVWAVNRRPKIARRITAYPVLRNEPDLSRERIGNRSAQPAAWGCSSALERLQRKKRLYDLEPETGLVSAEPVDEFVIEVGQPQVAERDAARRARRRASVTIGTELVGAVATGGDLLAEFEIAFGERDGSALPSGIDRFLARAPEGLEDFALHAQQSRFNRGRPSHSPKERSEPMDKFPLDRGLGQILRYDGRFEDPIRLGILQGLDDGLGRQPVSQRIPARDMFAVGARRPGAFERAEPIGLDLPGRGHARLGTASAVPGAASFRVRRPARAFVATLALGASAAAG